VDADAFLPVRGARLFEAGHHRLFAGNIDLAEQAADRAGDLLASSSFRSKIATWTPLAASASAVARPSPEAPPVTTAAVPASIRILLSHDLTDRLNHGSRHGKSRSENVGLVPSAARSFSSACALSWWTRGMLTSSTCAISARFSSSTK
jgi:hypothetical protein